jgi:cytochrome c5
MIKSIRYLLAVSCLSLLACGQQAAPTKADTAIAAANLLPANTDLADIYQRSCQSCHVLADTGAPLTGDVAAWQPRIEQGMDTLLQHVIEGYGGMPPLGMCFECNEQQFTALIEFMAGSQH